MITPIQYGTLATKEIFADCAKDRTQIKNFLPSHINVMVPNAEKQSLFKKMKISQQTLAFVFFAIKSRVCRYNYVFNVIIHFLYRPVGS